MLATVAIHNPRNSRVMAGTATGTGGGGGGGGTTGAVGASSAEQAASSAASSAAEKMRVMAARGVAVVNSMT